VENLLEKLPPWNKHIGRALEGSEALIVIGLLVVMGITIWALARWDNKFKALWLAYLISP